MTTSITPKNVHRDGQPSPEGAQILKRSHQAEGPTVSHDPPIIQAKSNDTSIAQSPLTFGHTNLASRSIDGADCALISCLLL